MEKVPARTTGPLTDVNSLRPSIVGTDIHRALHLALWLVQVESSQGLAQEIFFLLLLHVITVL